MDIWPKWSDWKRMYNFTWKASKLQFIWLNEIGKYFKIDRYCGIFCENLSWINVIQNKVRCPVSGSRSVQSPDIDITGSVSVWNPQPRFTWRTLSCDSVFREMTGQPRKLFLFSAEQTVLFFSKTSRPAPRSTNPATGQVPGAFLLV
jgi:hypothetical protein